MATSGSMPSRKRKTLAPFRRYRRRPAFWLLLALYASPFEVSRTKSFLMRRLGARVGRGVRFGRKSVVLCRRFRDTQVGDFTKFGDRARITVGSLTTGEDSRIDAEVWIRGRGTFRVGSGCYVGARSYIDVNRDVTIEDDAGVGPGSWIFTHSIWQSVLEGGPRFFAPVLIERNAWVPANVFIMPGVTIGAGAVVGARSLVTTDIPPGVLAAGSPAKVVKTAEERAQDRLDPEAQQRLVASVLDEFARLAQDYDLADSLHRREGRGFNTYEFRKGNNPCAVMAVCHERLLPSHVDGPATTWIAMKGIDAEAHPRLRGRAWFDLETGRRSESWDPITQLLHEVFRGEFGVRFRIGS